MTQEALKLALEALEEAWYHVGTFQPTEKAIDLYDEARAAIKEALANVAINDTSKERVDEMQKQRHEQEPVAWMDADGKTFPFVWNVALLGVRQGSKYLDESLTPLYTTPPQRTWQGLTDEEIETIWRKVEAGDFYDCVLPFAEKLEARLKEKNT